MKRPSAIVLCASVSLAAHAVLLSAITPAVRPAAVASSRTQIGSLGGQGRDRIHVRMLVAQAETQPELHAEPLAAQSAEATPTPETQATQETPAPPTSANTAHPAPGVDDYLPRPLLSAPPVVRTPVLMAAPPGETEIARRVGTLSLFIDEHGQVHHIVANEPRLPIAFEQAARDAFMAAHFSPGQLEGQAVKSRIRVEVVFDNTPITD
ncbi:MAG: hypothetical protein Q7U28_11880 [Aquabacterium sp.]|nr:hypothetical protein [Aquabacterium sp.]